MAFNQPLARAYALKEKLNKMNKNTSINWDIWFLDSMISRLEGLYQKRNSKSSWKARAVGYNVYLNLEKGIFYLQNKFPMLSESEMKQINIIKHYMKSCWKTDADKYTFWFYKLSLDLRQMIMGLNIPSILERLKAQLDTYKEDPYYWRLLEDKLKYNSNHRD